MPWFPSFTLLTLLLLLESLESGQEGTGNLPKEFFFKLFHYVSLGLKEQVFPPLILISVGSHSCVVTWLS